MVLKILRYEIKSLSLCCINKLKMGLSEYIGKIVKSKKEELGLSRYELERRSGISYNQIMNIERGESTTTRILDKLFDLLGLEVIIRDKEI